METNRVKIPEIRTEVMRKDDERKGAGVGLLAKLGLGGGASAGGAGGFAAGGGLLAGKAGVVALILAGSSVAAGIGLIAFGDGSGRGPVAGSSVFAKAEGAAAPGDSAEAFSDSPAPAAGEVSGSLDNFHKANQGAVQDPYAVKPAEEVKDAAAPAEAWPAAAPDNTTTASPGTTPPAAAARPKMVKGSGFGGSNTSSGGSGASGGGTLSARGPMGASSDLSRGAAGASSALRAGSRAAGATRRSSIMSGKGASSQLKAHSAQLRRSIGSGNLMQSGSVMDGGGAAGGVGGPGGAITGGGAGAGGRGVDSSPNASLSQNLKEVEPPPAPEKQENKSPYQKYMTAAMVLMAVGMVALLAAGLFSKKAKADPTGSAATMVKVLAGIATAASVAAAALGVLIATKYQQTMQGMMIAVIGGFTAFKAAEILMNDEGGTEAKAKSGAESQAAAQESGSKLGAKIPDGTRFEGGVTAQNGKFIPDPGSTMTAPASPNYPHGATGVYQNGGWQITPNPPPVTNGFGPNALPNYGNPGQTSALPPGHAIT